MSTIGSRGLGYDKLGPAQPLGLAEYSPKTANGKLDTRLCEKRLKEDYPAVAYWVSWHSWPTESWSLVSNRNTRELLESEYILTRDELPANGTKIVP